MLNGWQIAAVMVITFVATLMAAAALFYWWSQTNEFPFGW